MARGVEARPREPRAARYRAGDLLGAKYELERLAGEGSMGEVWLATNLALDLPVAIKLLRGKDSVDAEGHPTLSAALEEHLLREAQATAKLSHPAIVRVFDFGVTPLGDPFIVMERLEGEDLRDRLEREGRMSPEASLQLFLPVIHGMHTAHLRGIVHRDLKPENIFLTSDESGRLAPKIVDFGIAELPWLTEASDSVIAGTPAYMAPEQAAGHPHADHRVDIWSVCVALYEMIGGVTPFASGVVEESGERAAGSSAHPPSESETAKRLDESLGVDATLWTILERGLSRAPAKRWRSMRELGEALAEWLFARGIEEDVRGTSLKARWLYDSVTRQSLVTPTPAPVAVREEKTGRADSGVVARERAGNAVDDRNAVGDRNAADNRNAGDDRNAADNRNAGDDRNAADNRNAGDDRNADGDRTADDERGAAVPANEPSTAAGVDRAEPPRAETRDRSVGLSSAAKWAFGLSLVFAALGGALLFHWMQPVPLRLAERGLARTVSLTLLRAERKAGESHAAVDPPPTAIPSSTPPLGSASAKPRRPAAPSSPAPSADPASQVYPDSP